MKYADFEFGNNTLKFGDDNKVELKEFIPEGSNRTIRFFRKKGFTQGDKQAKIISRSGFSGLRDPFEIEPWNQILIDEANVYGTSVDENKELALRGKISDDMVMKETRMSVAKIMNEGLTGVARGQMVCHPESLIYGEIDEIGFDKETNTYFVGDTKTASSVDKITYGYQLGIYIEILRQLNPDKKISSIGMIDGVKIKKEKGVGNRDFDEGKGKDSIGKKVEKNDPVYRAKGNAKTPIETEEINLIIKRDLDDIDIIEQVQMDLAFIKQYKISSVAVIEDLKNNDDFNKDNFKLQATYDNIKGRIR